MTSLGIHCVDAMLALSGSVAEVDARSYRQAMPFDVDDTTMVFMRFANGATGYLGTVAYSATLWHVRVLGTKGWAEVRGATGFTKCLVGGTEESKTFPPNDSLKAGLEAFADAAAGAGAFAVTPDQIVHGTAVLEAIVKSAERGRPEPVG
jgi:predicted dehydrogenase